MELSDYNMTFDEGYNTRYNEAWQNWENPYEAETPEWDAWQNGFDQASDEVGREEEDEFEFPSNG